MSTFFDRLRMGVAAFREAYTTSHPVDTSDWSEQESRRLRYALSWAAYEGTSYRDVHAWATTYRKQYGLYKYIRPVFSPAYRLGEFWKAHLLGGLLGIKDGKAMDSGAIPITTDSEPLRAAIAELWKWSRWQVQKDVLTVRGAILGDAAIKIVDDAARERVYLSLLHPGDLESITRDAFGNIKEYAINVMRTDPTGKGRLVEYREVVTRNGPDVIYETFLNGVRYAWPENVDRAGNPTGLWAEPYGFVPLVVIQHNDVGLDWGWSELHPIRAKVQEADDLASLISDQVRKYIDPIWLMRGMKRADLTITGATDTADSDRPFPGREELQAIWNVPKDASAEPMIADLKLENALLHLDGVLKEIERDVLELSSDIHTASGDASGRALRTARQPVVSKVVERRANYEQGLIAAHGMAIAIGGWAGYPEYAGFDLQSYARGDLEHSITSHPVFEADPLDKIEIDAAFWQAAAAARKAGVSLEGYLRESGWDEKRINDMLETQPAPSLTDSQSHAIMGGQ